MTKWSVALDPRTKLLACIMLLAASFLLEEPAGVLLMSVMLVFVMWGSRVSFRLYGRKLLLISWLLAATFLTHAWGTGGAEGFTEGGIAVGKLGLMLGWVTILGSSSSPLELVSGLEGLCVPLRRVGVPIHDLSLVAMLSIRFLPLLSEEGQYLFHACLARGFGWNSGSLPTRLKNVGVLFLPLFSHLLRRVDHLTLAMENRAFQLDRERTSLYVLHMRRADYAVLCACLPALFFGCVL